MSLSIVQIFNIARPTAAFHSPLLIKLQLISIYYTKRTARAPGITGMGSQATGRDRRVQKHLECAGVPRQRHVKTLMGTLPSQAQLRHVIQVLKPGSDEGVFRERQKGTYTATSRSPVHSTPGGSGMSGKLRAILPGTSKPLVRLEVRKEARARPAVSAAQHIQGTRNV